MSPNWTGSDVPSCAARTWGASGHFPAISQPVSTNSCHILKLYFTHHLFVPKLFTTSTFMAGAGARQISASTLPAGHKGRQWTARTGG